MTDYRALASGWLAGAAGVSTPQVGMRQQNRLQGGLIGLRHLPRAGDRINEETSRVSMRVKALIELRNRTLDAYVDGQIGEDTSRADLNAIAIEIDRILSPDRQNDVDERAARVVGAILADGRARQAAVPAAKAARIEFWHCRRLERLRSEEPTADGAVLDGSRNSRRRSPTKSAWRGPCSRPSETSERSKAHPSACMRWPTARSRHRLLGSSRRFLT